MTTPSTKYVAPRFAWRPFPESKPQTQGFYLLTVYDETLKVNFTTMGLYSLAHHRFAPDRGRSRNVLAWMPLPTPYRRKVVEGAVK